MTDPDFRTERTETDTEGTETGTAARPAAFVAERVEGDAEFADAEAMEAGAAEAADSDGRDRGPGVAPMDVAIPAGGAASIGVAASTEYRMVDDEDVNAAGDEPISDAAPPGDESEDIPDHVVHGLLDALSGLLHAAALH
ncbi:hypothetical protein HLB23_10490 [Nocardia uniformis]|uniref:Uncharacterized protein n=1 Tax=Nocardia uniformis TaxID=53432 RepID=A0A849BYT6_9NOCA|nr:hypothetical protein [Nocardia uniformis]NNH70286.1 hypothetical protein [Nocardia uniformis]